MTLRKKALLITGVALILAVGFIYAASRLVLLEDLNEIEANEARKNVERVLSILYYGVSDLESLTLNWAAWDDTYAFIETRNEQYVQANLIGSSFSNLRLNLMLFINSSGETVFGSAFDLDKEEPMPLSPSLQRYLIENRSLFEQPGAKGSRSGIILLDEGPMLVALQPILTSAKQGPVRGTVVFGRYLDSSEISRLARTTLLQLHILPVRNLPKGSDFAKASVPLLIGGVPIFTQVLNERDIAGYTLVRDINGSPVLVLRVDSPRDIFQRGEISIAYYIVIVVGLGVIVAGVVFLLMQTQVLARFTKMVKDVAHVSETGDLSTRLSTTGSDELTLVTRTINGMLIALDESTKELKQRYERERELRQEVETEMQRRIEFTRALVHELKTPITPVLAASELLSEEAREEPYISLSQSIQRGALNLSKRIDELLDLARTEIGTLTLNPSPVNPAAIIQEVVTGTIPLALEKGQRLNLELPDSLPTVRADLDRFTQILQNIINNALKFTPEGGTINIKACADSANLVVEVEDTGRGLSDEEQAKLFDPYSRLPGDRERFSGLGLGLALSKKFVELHRGKIWVKSQKGVGSTFGFSIPLG